MNKIVFYSTLALIGTLAFSTLNSSAEDPKPTQRGREYLTIQYGGRFDSYVLFGNGKAQFFPELANLPRIDRVDERTQIMHTLMNRFAKEGYEFLETAEPNRVIMRK